jgi:hypothetical protein
MQKTLVKFALASGDFVEFYDLAMKYLKRQHKTIHQIKSEMECTDLETFYLYHKRLENLEKTV